MSLADECEVVLRVLLDEGPLSLDDLRERCGYAQHKLTALLNDLKSHGQVITFPIRVKGKKIIQFSIRENG